MNINRIEAGAFDYWYQIYDLFLVEMQNADEDEEPSEILNQDAYARYLELRRALGADGNDVVGPCRQMRTALYRRGINAMRKNVSP